MADPSCIDLGGAGVDERAYFKQIIEEM